MALTHPPSDQGDFPKPGGKATDERQSAQAEGKHASGMPQLPGAIQRQVDSSMRLVNRQKTRPIVKLGIEAEQKVMRDEVYKLSAMLAYYLLMSIVPIMLLLLSIFGLIIDTLSLQTNHTLIHRLTTVLPISQEFIQLALSRLAKHSGVLALATFLVSAYYGTRLFTILDYCFNRIYGLSARQGLRKWLLAIKMLLLFILMIPVLFVISAIPSVLSTTLVRYLFGDSTTSRILIALASALAGLLIASTLFLMVYMVIPNRRVSLREAWKGALLAGLALEIYLLAFPFYAARSLNLNDNASTAGFALVILVLFYYMGLILLLGAEINVFLGAHYQHATHASGAPDPGESQTASSGTDALARAAPAAERPTEEAGGG